MEAIHDVRDHDLRWLWMNEGKFEKLKIIQNEIENIPENGKPHKLSNHGNNGPKIMAIWWIRIEETTAVLHNKKGQQEKVLIGKFLKEIQQTSFKKIYNPTSALSKNA